MKSSSEYQIYSLADGIETQLLKTCDTFEDAAKYIESKSITNYTIRRVSKGKTRETVFEIKSTLSALDN